MAQLTRRGDIVGFAADEQGGPVALVTAAESQEHLSLVAYTTEGQVGIAEVPWLLENFHSSVTGGDIYFTAFDETGEDLLLAMSSISGEGTHLVRTCTGSSIKGRAPVVVSDGHLLFAAPRGESDLQDGKRGRPTAEALAILDLASGEIGGIDLSFSDRQLR